MLPKAKKNTTQPTTPHQLSSLIKSARDIMRKDKGLNGDLDRLPMLTWIMFLKFIDDLERIREGEEKMAGKKFRQAIEPPYRWRDWASRPDGITGDTLIAFVNNDETMRPDGKRGLGLFAYLRCLEGGNGGDRRDVIATVFKGINNRMINGYLLRDVINKVEEIHFTSSEEIHTLGRLYEAMMREMRDAAGDSGEFYTPRPVVCFMVKAVNPRLGELVLDPACGTGGFLVESFAHLEKQCRTIQQREILQSRSIIGGEAKPLPYLLAQMNLLLHGLEAPKVNSGNSLAVKVSEIGEKDRVDVILTNPPFGGEEERGIQGNFPADKRTSETALLFLQLIMRKIRRKVGRSGTKGRAAVIVPDGTLSDLGVAATIRRELLQEFTLRAIVQLPPGAFSPYAETARTNILFFEYPGPTKRVWYYRVPAPNAKSQCSKTNPLTDRDFLPVVEWWDEPAVTAHSWMVERFEIDPSSCNLLRRNPAFTKSDSNLNLLDVIRKSEEQVHDVLVGLRSLEALLPSLSPKGRRLDSFLRKSQVPMLVDDATYYKQITVQYHHRGARLRGVQRGSEIGTKRQFVVRRGQLILSRIDARYGALSLVPTELDGAIVTGDFWVFDIDSGQVDPGYLDLFLALPEFADFCERASRGTTRRQRLALGLFMEISIPWLPLDQQRLIVDRVVIAMRLTSLLSDLAGTVGSLPRDLTRQIFGFKWVEENVERMLRIAAIDSIEDD